MGSNTEHKAAELLEWARGVRFSAALLSLILEGSVVISGWQPEGLSVRIKGGE